MVDCQKNTEETVSLLCNPQKKRRCPRNVGETPKEMGKTPKEMGETPRNLGEPEDSHFVEITMDSRLS